MVRPAWRAMSSKWEFQAMGGFAGAFWADKETHNKLMETRTLKKRIRCSCGQVWVNEKRGLKLPVMLPREILNVFERAPRGIFQSGSWRKLPSQCFALRSLNLPEEPDIRLQNNSWVWEGILGERRILYQVVEQPAYGQ